MLNAANEAAVGAFLDERLSFTVIAEVVDRTLDAVPAETVRHFDVLLRADAVARERAAALVERVAA